MTLDHAATPKVVRSDLIQSFQSKVPHPQPTIRRRKYNTMVSPRRPPSLAHANNASKSPRVTNVASPTPSGCSITSARAIVGGSGIHEPQDDPAEIFRQSIAVCLRAASHLAMTLLTTPGFSIQSQHERQKVPNLKPKHPVEYV